MRIPVSLSVHRQRHNSHLKFSFAATRNRLVTGGWAREVTVRELPVATELAGVNMRLKPGGIRELHWHKEAEWGFMLLGRCQWMALTPPELVQAHLNLDRRTMSALRKDKPIIVK
jgi:hypothetical protein